MDKVIYRTNVIRGGSKLLPLIIGTYGIMTPMFICIYLGVSDWLTLLITLASGFLAVSLIVHKGEYILDANGITETLRPFWSKDNSSKEGKFFPWSAIRAYKLWSDLPKGAISFDKTDAKVVLEIYLKKNSYKIVFNNGKTMESRAGFAKFTEAFLAKVEEMNNTPLVADPRPSDPKVGAPELQHPVIERKRSFYEMPVAKLVTLLFIAATIGIAYFVVQGYGSWTSAYKLLFVLVPGVAYMFWRTFMKSGRD